MILQNDASGRRDIGLAIRRLVVFVLPALLLVGAIMINVVMGMLAPRPEEDEEVIKATPVVVAEAVAEPVQLSVSTQGEATPLREITFAPQIAGKVTYISPEFIEGGAFEKDDILIRIDPAQYEYRVVQAKSSVAQARGAFLAEEAEARIARENWEELGQGEGAALALREPQLAEAAANLASAEASLREAELQLARATIRAPFKGRVRAKSVDIGDYVSPGGQLGEVFSTDVMRVALPLTDNEFGQLGLQIGFRESATDKGPKVTLNALVAGQPRVWTGRVVRTSNAYDRETRVLFAYAEVEDPYGAGSDNGAPLAAGLFVNAKIDGRLIENAVTVPRTALRGEDKVYIARDDKTLEIRPVVVASSNRTMAILTGGLNAGERVITSPVRGVADGIEIAVAGDEEEEPEESQEGDEDGDADAPTIAEATN